MGTSPFSKLLIFLVRCYQATLGPLLGGNCRFEPSCSNYCIEALRRHGAWRGLRLSGRRLLRCRPFGPCGYDPVPPLRGSPESSGSTRELKPATPNDGEIISPAAAGRGLR